MGIKLQERTPIDETVVGKATRKYALRKAGIDPRTAAEKKEDETRLNNARRWWSKTGGDLEA